jgi:preprotein translocase subunit SecA
MRKHVLQYDDVLSTQREVIYRERRRILEKAELKEAILEMLEEHLDIVLANHIDSEAPPESWEEEGLPEVLNILRADIPMFSDIQISELYGMSYTDLREKLLDSIRLAYDVREQYIGIENMRELERQILLRTIDGKWVDYLHSIDQLREGIHLRGYGQRDPLQEYKREAFDMFNHLLRAIQQESIQLVFRAQPMAMDMQELEELLPSDLLFSDESSDDADIAEADTVDSSTGPKPPVIT